MNGGPPIAVVLSADFAFTKQLAVAIAGISRTATREHQVFVLHDGYDPALMRDISSAARAGVNLRWLDARSGRLDSRALPPGYHTASLFRLRIGELLPAEIERVIYLDSDVAVRRPLDELWDTELDGRVVAAVRDAFVPWAAAPTGLPWSELGVAPDAPYLNSGVLVIDLNLWRAHGLGEQALDLLGDYSFNYGDQCALNAVLAGKWKHLSPEWNVQAGHLVSKGSLAWVTEPRDTLSAAIDDPAIVHFNNSGLRKPWEHRCSHPYRDLWFELLNRTAWNGWRPPEPPRRGLARRMVGRVQRAGSTLIHG